MLSQGPGSRPCHWAWTTCCKVQEFEVGGSWNYLQTFEITHQPPPRRGRHYWTRISSSGVRTASVKPMIDFGFVSFSRHTKITNKGSRNLRTVQWRKPKKSNGIQSRNVCQKVFSFFFECCSGSSSAASSIFQELSGRIRSSSQFLEHCVGLLWKYWKVFANHRQQINLTCFWSFLRIIKPVFTMTELTEIQKKLYKLP